MTDRAAMLAAILAQPAEDTPRLAFADWLEDRAEPPEPERAEFIRTQIHDPFGTEFALLICDLYNGPSCGDDWREGPNYPILDGQPLRCGYEHLPGNAAFFRDWCRWPVPTSLRYSRGFVSSLTCTWDAWRTHAAAITAAQPIERVRLTTRPTYRIEDQHGNSPGFEMPFAGDNLPWLAKKWPRITFELPPEREWQTVRGNVDLDSFNAIIGDVIQSTALESYTPR